jgi:hypothetical protein
VTSVRIEARRALTDLIRAEIADTDTDVFYGMPGPQHIGKRSAVWIGDITGVAQERRISNRGHRQDNFEIEVTCVAGPNAVPNSNQNFYPTDTEKYQAHDE